MPIIDQGYQHWSGQLSGHAWRWLTIARHGIRVGMKEPYLKLLLLGACVPAVLLALALCLWGLLERNATTFQLFMEFLRSIGFGPEVVANPRTFRVDFWTIAYSIFMSYELSVAMILILLVGRQLISQDLRFNAMPLYFSRPLRRFDYFLGKLAIIGGFLGMVIIAPALLAYVLGLAFSLDLSIIPDTLPLLISVVVYGVVISVSAGMLVLAISSLTRNSRNVGLLWVGLWLVSSVTAGMLNASYQFQMEQHRYEIQQGSDVEPQVDRTNWRPMVSYTENLACVGRHLLGTDACWQHLASLQPPSMRFRLVTSHPGPQYPWYWSLAVLLALFGISVYILHFRVRSLDRLK